MTDFFHQKGILAVQIGGGWLSSFEAAALAPGDVVRTQQLAGYPATLLYNGAPLCPCEVVILEDRFGARIVRPGLTHPPVTGPGTADEVTELLPAAIILGSISVSLADLAGAGPNTIISLGIPYAKEDDADLVVADAERLSTLSG